jgi:hypothetical protein
MMQLFDFIGYWEEEEENYITLHVNPNSIAYIFDTPNKEGHTSIRFIGELDYFIITSDQFRRPEEGVQA